MIRRLAPAALVSIALLAGCGAADDPAGTDPAAPTVEATTPTSPPTTAEAAPETTDAGEPSIEPTTAGPTMEPEETAGDVEPDTGSNPTDLVEGVRTNDFNRMPKEVAKLPQRQSDTSPTEHMARFDYVDDGAGRVHVQAQLLPEEEGGEIVELTSLDDPRIDHALTHVRDTWEGEGFTAEEFSVEAGEMDWECLLAPASQGDGTLDHAFCLSHRYGRVIEVQTFFDHVDDEATRPNTVVVALADVSVGLDGVKP